MSVKQCKESIGSDLYQTLRKQKKLSLKHILFISHYITNGFNATDAYANSIARKNARRTSCATHGLETVKRPEIQDAIKIVIDKWLGEKKLKLEKEIIDRLYVKAFYSPEMFINPNGTARFKSWEDIPEKYRCCVEGIEVKYFGKNIGEKVVIKLADQYRAMAELSKYIELYKGADAANSVTMSEETVVKLAEVFNRGKENK